MNSYALPARFLLLIVMFLTTAVCAQPQWPELLDVDLNYRNSAEPWPDRAWDIRLGAGFEREPTYQGSDRSQTEADLFLLAAYRGDFGNVYLAGDGFGFSRMIGERFGLNLQLEMEDTREIEDDSRLIGLGNQEEELELEIAGRYFMGPYTVDGAVALATGDKGVVWFVGGSRSWRLMDNNLFLTLQADLSGSDRDNQRTDFGITAEQSAASVLGFPVYEPDGGLKSFGLGLNADYQINKHWSLFMQLDYERLLGDVADSPLVSQIGSDNIIELGIGFYYRF